MAYLLYPCMSTMNLPQILQFLTQLQQNNNKEWMDANRSTYQAARHTLIEITSQLIHSIGKFDPALASISPNKCVFRINRDIRFSKDKSPYKRNLGAYFSKEGAGCDYASYYLHLEPHNQSFVAGGMYVPSPSLLKRIRQEIDYNGNQLTQIVENTAFKSLFGPLQGDRLQRPPKGYDENNPYIDWIKHKSLLAVHPLTDAMVARPDFVSYVAGCFEMLILHGKAIGSDSPMHSLSSKLHAMVQPLIHGPHNSSPTLKIAPMAGYMLIFPSKSGEISA
eukprot:gene3036-3797_t